MKIETVCKIILVIITAGLGILSVILYGHLNGTQSVFYSIFTGAYFLTLKGEEDGHKD